MNPDAYIEMAETEARHWWFTGRRSILAHLIGAMELPPGARILEVGSGTGGNLQMLSSFGRVSAVEKDEAARAITAKKTGACFDVRPGSCPGDLPFKEEKFDLICLFDVLEHIDEDVETLVALKGYLARGGRIMVTVPAYRWLWSSHDDFLHHKRRYSKAEFRKKVEASGLQPVRITHFNTFLFPLVAIARLKERLFRSSTASGSTIPPMPINQVLATLFRGERFLLDRMNLPFGLSLLGILEAEHV